MSVSYSSKVKDIRSGLDHPVIDSDGHTVEVTAVLQDFIKDVGGVNGLARFEALRKRSPRQASADERRDDWRSSPTHWFWSTNALDRATAMIPRLYHERMDEIGLDFSLVYPSNGLGLQMMSDDELRPMACRALNMYLAETHSGLSDRLLPVAAIPMHTPEEAIEEIEYAVNVLGMRAVVIPSFVCRPIPRIHREHPEYDGMVFRFDTFGLDSEYDYDPVWAKCVELKVVPGVHTITHGYGFRTSISNYIYNHIGSFATSCEAVCKSLLLGGVFHRFPELKVAALEGGVGWAASLYADFLRHWEKRSGQTIQDLNPTRLDSDLLRSLVNKYGSERFQTKSDEIMDSVVNPDSARPDWTNMAPPLTIDEFSKCPVQSPEEFRDLFLSHIYIGCEADDPMNALAFNARLNPYSARFPVIFGSDISHWDVPDLSEVFEEAYELVEHGLITDDDFRDFTFTNPACLYAGTNPDFYRGTVVEAAVAEYLRGSGTSEPSVPGSSAPGQ